MKVNQIIKILVLCTGLVFSGHINATDGNNQGKKQFQRPQEKYGTLFSQILMNDSLFGPDKYFVESKTLVPT